MQMPLQLSGILIKSVDWTCQAFTAPHLLQVLKHHSLNVRFCPTWLLFLCASSRRQHFTNGHFRYSRDFKRKDARICGVQNCACEGLGAGEIFLQTKLVLQASVLLHRL